MGLTDILLHRENEAKTKEWQVIVFQTVEGLKDLSHKRPPFQTELILMGLLLSSFPSSRGVCSFTNKEVAGVNDICNIDMMMHYVVAI